MGNYSDGGINSNINDEPSRTDLLNFNQVEKDSSIQQIKTHEDDDDKYLSSGSKASDIEEEDNMQRIRAGEKSGKAISSKLSL